MTWRDAYFLVGAVAAIRGSDTGCLGMLLLLTCWPVFALAGLANLGLRSVARGNQRRRF
jgi:hypothetical protein